MSKGQNAKVSLDPVAANKAGPYTLSSCPSCGRRPPAWELVWPSCTGDPPLLETHPSHFRSALPPPASWRCCWTAHPATDTHCSAPSSAEKCPPAHCPLRSMGVLLEHGSALLWSSEMMLPSRERSQRASLFRTL